MHTSSYDQYSGTGLIEEKEEKEEQSGWPRQRIYREANLEATMTLDNFEKVKAEQIGPFPKPSGVAYPATLDSLFAHLEKDQLQEGENLNLNGYSNRDRYLLVQIRSSADLSLKEEVYFIKEGDFFISLSLPELMPGENSLTYYDLVPFAGIKEGGKLCILNR